MQIKCFQNLNVFVAFISQRSFNFETPIIIFSVRIADVKLRSPFCKITQDKCKKCAVSGFLRSDIRFVRTDIPSDICWGWGWGVA